MKKSPTALFEKTALELSKNQRSHNLFVLGNANKHLENEFNKWFKGDCLETISNQDSVLTAQHFKRHDLDVTEGISKEIGYSHLGVYELYLDGAEQAEGLIDLISSVFKSEKSAEMPATWIYFPVSQKVGKPQENEMSFIQIAFTNAAEGTESEFREWYSTRHIRHALNIPALINGQCFELTRFQKPGATLPEYSTVVVYEMDGGPEDIMKGAASLPSNVLDFPTLDLTRFSEWTFYPVTKRIVDTCHF